LDEVSDILQRSESDTIYNSKQVQIVFTQVSASAVSENQFTLDYLIKDTGADNSNVSTADEEPGYSPPPPPSSTTGGGASGQTIATGAGASEDTRGQTGQFNPGLAGGASPTAGDAQQ
jgi:hypothetical protein